MLILFSFYVVYSLNARRVKHNSYGLTLGLGGEVLSKASANNTTVTVRFANFTPDDTDLGAVLLTLSSVDVGDTLTEVGVNLRAVDNALETEKRPLRVLVNVAAAKIR